MHSAAILTRLSDTTPSADTKEYPRSLSYADEKGRKISLRSLNSDGETVVPPKERLHVIFQDGADQDEMTLPVLDIGNHHNVLYTLNNLSNPHYPISFKIDSWDGYESVSVTFADSPVNVFFKRVSSPAETRVVSAEEKEIIDAANSGNVKKLNEYLYGGLSADTRDEKGSPILWQAATHGHLQCVRTLLDHKADIDARDTLQGTTALMSVVFHNKLGREEDKETKTPETLHKMIDLLVTRKANVNSQSKSGSTILHYLTQTLKPYNFELTNYLLAKGANPFIVNVAGLRPSCSHAPYFWSEFATPERCKKDVRKLLFRTTMHYDAHPRIESVVLMRNAHGNYGYEFTFKNGLTTAEKRHAWEAVCNKLKSIMVDASHVYSDGSYAIGLADDDTPCIFLKDDHSDHAADTQIPRCHYYVIASIEFKRDDSFVVLIKRDQFSEKVHAAVAKGLGELALSVRNESGHAEYSISVPVASADRYAPPVVQENANKHASLVTGGLIAAGVGLFAMSGVATSVLSSVVNVLRPR